MTSNARDPNLPVFLENLDRTPPPRSAEIHPWLLRQPFRQPPVSTSKGFSLSPSVHLRLHLLNLLSLWLLLSPLQAQNREILAEFKIGIIGKNQEAAIYQAAHLGAMDAARELSEKYSIDVELLIATPNPTQNESQPTSLAELFVGDADGFLISPRADEAIAANIRFAQSQNQEVVFFESELPDAQPLAAILADEVAAGRLAGEAMLPLLPTKARVAILTAEKPTPQLEQRLQGLRTALGYRRIQKIITTDPDYQSAIRAIRAAEAADHDKLIFGWVFLEDWPLQGMPALPWKPGKKPVVAIQSSPSAFIYSDQGYLNALVVHPYYEWGYLGVQALVEKLYLGQRPESSRILTSPRLVDWRNFEAYRENWKVWFK